MAERQKLNIDFESLFPGSPLTIGTTQVIIRPLGVYQLALLGRQLKNLGTVLSKDGITWNNYKEPSNLFKIAVIVIEQFPAILEEASNIALEDLQALPIDVLVDVIAKVIEVNIESKDNLVKNWERLAEKLGLEDKKKKNSQK